MHSFLSNSARSRIRVELTWIRPVRKPPDPVVKKNTGSASDSRKNPDPTYSGLGSKPGNDKERDPDPAGQMMRIYNRKIIYFLSPRFLNTMNGKPVTELQLIDKATIEGK